MKMDSFNQTFKRLIAAYGVPSHVRQGNSNSNSLLPDMKTWAVNFYSLVKHIPTEEFDTTVTRWITTNAYWPRISELLELHESLFPGQPSTVHPEDQTAWDENRRHVQAFKEAEKWLNSLSYRDRESVWTQCESEALHQITDMDPDDPLTGPIYRARLRLLKEKALIRHYQALGEKETA